MQTIAVRVVQRTVIAARTLPPAPAVSAVGTLIRVRMDQVYVFSVLTTALHARTVPIVQSVWMVSI